MPVGLFHLTPVVGALLMEGATQDGERFLIVAAETVERLAGFEHEIEKEALERFHLECFRADHVLKTGHSPFGNVLRGGEPPDFEVETEAGMQGVDCAAFADHHRRLGYRLMEQLRNRLVQGAGGRNFSGIAGCVLSIWFGPRLGDLPPKRWDDSLVDPLLDAMARCHIDRAEVSKLSEQIAERGFPQVMPPVIATATTPDGAAGFVANVLTTPTEGVRFSTGLGFEMQLGRPAEVTATAVLANLLRIGGTHDQPEIDHLVLTAGGPDRAGMRYPGEEAVAAFLLQQPGLNLEAKHLQKVSMHLWSGRKIVEIPLNGS